MGRWAVVLLLVPLGAAAGDYGFDSLAGQIERAYHVKPQHIRLLGAARLAARPARSFGGRPFHLAVFENLPEDRPRLKLEPPGMGWQSMVRSETQPGRETVCIYARADGNRIRVLILSEESDEITLVESEVKPSEFARRLRDDVNGLGAGDDDE